MTRRPSLHSHYRSFVTTTNRSASAPRIGTRSLAVSATWDTPSRPLECGQYRNAPSPVPCETSRSGSRHLHAGHHLASKRMTARLILELAKDPSFDAICLLNDASAMIRFRSSSRSLPDASGTPFPHRSPRSRYRSRSMRRFGISFRKAIPKGHTFISHTASLPEAVLRPTPFRVQDTISQCSSGRFEAFPRRTAPKGHNPSSSTQHRIKKLYLHQASLCVRDTRQRRQPYPVRGLIPHPLHMTTQHGIFMTKHQ